MALTGSTIAAEVGKFLGDPYVYGAAGPTNFDCSGLVQYVLTQLGLKNVPRTSEDQWAWVQRIGYSDLQPGDLVFSQWPGDDAAPGHVAVYVGGGNLIEAPSPGQSVHQVPLDSGYRNYVVGYGRVPGAAVGGGAGGAVSATNATTAGFSLNPLSGVADAINTVFGPISSAFAEFYQGFVVAMRAVVWLVNPANWVRIIAGIVGTASLIVGLVFVAKAA